MIGKSQRINNKLKRQVKRQKHFKIKKYNLVSKNIIYNLYMYALYKETFTTELYIY